MKAGVSVQAGAQSDFNGVLVTSAKFKVKKSNWLPSDAEQSCVYSLMQHVAESEKMAGSMALPDCGINAQTLACTEMKL